MEKAVTNINKELIALTVCKKIRGEGGVATSSSLSYNLVILLNDRIQGNLTSCYILARHTY